MRGTTQLCCEATWPEWEVIFSLIHQYVYNNSQTQIETTFTQLFVKPFWKNQRCCLGKHRKHILRSSQAHFETVQSHNYVPPPTHTHTIFPSAMVVVLSYCTMLETCSCCLACSIRFSSLYCRFSRHPWKLLLEACLCGPWHWVAPRLIWWRNTHIPMAQLGLRVSWIFYRARHKCKQ